MEDEHSVLPVESETLAAHASPRPVAGVIPSLLVVPDEGEAVRDERAPSGDDVEPLLNILSMVLGEDIALFPDPDVGSFFVVLSRGRVVFTFNPKHTIMTELVRISKLDGAVMRDLVPRDAILAIFDTASIASGLVAAEPQQFTGRIHRMLSLVLSGFDDDDDESGDERAKHC